MAMTCKGFRIQGSKKALLSAKSVNFFGSKKVLRVNVTNYAVLVATHLEV